jgi:hypothetical protein
MTSERMPGCTGPYHQPRLVPTLPLQRMGRILPIGAGTAELLLHPPGPTDYAPSINGR